MACLLPKDYRQPNIKSAVKGITKVESHFTSISVLSTNNKFREDLSISRRHVCITGGMANHPLTGLYIRFCSYRNSMHWWSIIHRNRIILAMRKDNGNCLTPHTIGSAIKHSWILKTLLVLIVLIANLEHVSAGMEPSVCFFWNFFVITFWLAIVCCEYSAIHDRTDLLGQGLLS